MHQNEYMYTHLEYSFLDWIQMVILGDTKAIAISFLRRSHFPSIILIIDKLGLALQLDTDLILSCLGSYVASGIYQKQEHPPPPPPLAFRPQIYLGGHFVQWLENPPSIRRLNGWILITRATPSEPRNWHTSPGFLQPFITPWHPYLPQPGGWLPWKVTSRLEIGSIKLFFFLSLCRDGYHFANLAQR